LIGTLLGIPGVGETIPVLYYHFLMRDITLLMGFLLGKDVGHFVDLKRGSI
jgi:hypothetical protein